MGESSKGNGKVRVGDNVLSVNLLPYLAEAYTYSLKVGRILCIILFKVGTILDVRSLPLSRK